MIVPVHDGRHRWVCVQGQVQVQVKFSFSLEFELEYRVHDRVHHESLFEYAVRYRVHRETLTPCLSTWRWSPWSLGQGLFEFSSGTKVWDSSTVRTTEFVSRSPPKFSFVVRDSSAVPASCLSTAFTAERVDSSLWSGLVVRVVSVFVGHDQVDRSQSSLRSFVTTEHVDRDNCSNI